jgi:hypothetical protein
VKAQLTFADPQSAALCTGKAMPSSLPSPKFVSEKLMTKEVVPDENVVPAIVETIEKDKLR